MYKKLLINGGFLLFKEKRFDKFVFVLINKYYDIFFFIVIYIINFSLIKYFLN